MNDLDPKQMLAAQMLAGGGRCRDAAIACGVSPETISHWRARPEFIAYSNDLRQQAAQAALDALRDLGAEAVEVLKKLLFGATSEAVRLRSAEVILRNLFAVDTRQGAMVIGPTDATVVKKNQERARSAELLGFVMD